MGNSGGLNSESETILEADQLCGPHAVADVKVSAYGHPIGQSKRHDFPFELLVLITYMASPGIDLGLKIFTVVVAIRAIPSLHVLHVHVLALSPGQ